MTMRFAYALGVLVALTGCGTTVQIEGASSGGGGEAVATSSSGQGGSGASTSSTGGSGGGGAPPICSTPPNDRFELSAVLNGVSLGCDTDFWSEGGEVTVDGVVVATQEGYLAIDSCPLNAICDSTAFQEIYFNADELFNPIPTGTLVQATVRMDMDWSCRHRLLVTNLPTWEGLTNPVATGTNVWLAGSDGVIDALPIAPYNVDLIPLECHDPQRAHYQLRFMNDLDNNSLILRMGESALWLFGNNNSPYNVQVRNLSSYELTGVDDAGFNGSYWMAALVIDAHDE